MTAGTQPPCLTAMMDSAAAAAAKAAADKAAAEASQAQASHLADVAAKLKDAIAAYVEARHAKSADVAEIDTRLAALERNLKCYLTEACTDALDAAREKYELDLKAKLDAKASADKALHKCTAGCDEDCTLPHTVVDGLQKQIEETLQEGTAFAARVASLKAEIDRIEKVVCDAAGDRVSAYVDFLEVARSRGGLWNGLDGTAKPEDGLCERVTKLLADLDAANLELQKCKDGLAKLNEALDKATKAYEEFKKRRVEEMVDAAKVPCAAAPAGPAPSPAPGSAAA